MQAVTPHAQQKRQEQWLQRVRAAKLRAADRALWGASDAPSLWQRAAAAWRFKALRHLAGNALLSLEDLAFTVVLDPAHCAAVRQPAPTPAAEPIVGQSLASSVRR